MDFEPVKEYEGLYEININGEVRGVKRKGTNGLLLKPAISKVGYKNVSLFKNGKGKTYLIHRLLALQYIPNPYDLPYVDHIDRNKLNNDLSNLRWASPSLNSENRTCKGCIVIDKRVINEIEYTYYRVCYRKTKKRFKTIKEAEDYLQYLILTFP